MKSKAIRNFVYAITGIGILLALITTFAGENDSLWFTLWASAPYLAYWIAALKAKSKGGILGGGLGIVGLDILIHAQVFYFPKSSTDAIAIILMPFWQLVLILPVGFLFGWIIEKLVYRTALKSEQNYG